MNASTAFAVGNFVLGSSVRCGLMYAQWAENLAPSFTHCFITSTSRGVSFLPVLAGGMRLASSWLAVRRVMSSLWSGLPGTTELAAPSAVSSRSFALRVFSSGPWH